MTDQLTQLEAEIEQLRMENAKLRQNLLDIGNALGQHVSELLDMEGALVENGGEETKELAQEIEAIMDAESQNISGDSYHALANIVIALRGAKDA
jgi:serine phosphatase RsbU (regulator of sigma subunit)